MTELIAYLAVTFIVGVIIGSLTFSHVIFKIHEVGTLVIDDSSEEVTSYRLVIEDVPLEELPKNDYVSLRIKYEE